MDTAKVGTQTADRAPSGQSPDEEEPGELEALEQVRKCLVWLNRKKKTFKADYSRLNWFNI